MTVETGERLARIEAAIAGMQGEIAGMRDMLARLVRIEERMAVHFESESAAREQIKRMHDRLEAVERRVDGMRTPLLWFAGVLSAVIASVASVFIGRSM